MVQALLCFTKYKYIHQHRDYYLVQFQAHITLESTYAEEWLNKQPTMETNKKIITKGNKASVMREVNINNVDSCEIY